MEWWRLHASEKPQRHKQTKDLSMFKGVHWLSLYCFTSRSIMYLYYLINYIMWRDGTHFVCWALLKWKDFLILSSAVTEILPIRRTINQSILPYLFLPDRWRGEATEWVPPGTTSWHDRSDITPLWDHSKSKTSILVFVFLLVIYEVKYLCL